MLGVAGNVGNLVEAACACISSRRPRKTTVRTRGPPSAPTVASWQKRLGGAVFFFSAVFKNPTHGVDMLAVLVHPLVRPQEE